MSKRKKKEVQLTEAESEFVQESLRILNVSAKKRVKTRNPERLMIELLKLRPPEEWAAALMVVPEEIRPQVARVIWWDFFAGRDVANRWDHLDVYLKTRNPEAYKAKIAAGWTRDQINDAEYGRDPSCEEMAAALVDCGYPPSYAKSRA